MGENRDRQKTNSVTHLVKIIAEEVVNHTIDNSYNHLSSRIAGLHDRLNKLEAERLNKIDVNEFVDGIVNDLENAGTSWTAEEDQLLQAELDIVFAHLAKRHGRTEVAIRSRLFKDYKRIYPNVYPNK